MDPGILNKLSSFRELKGKSTEEIRTLIEKGRTIKAWDAKALDERGILRSHYHLSQEDKDALSAASIYDILVGRNIDCSGIITYPTLTN